MRKRIRLEEFISRRLPGAPAAVQDVTAWYSRPGLCAHFSVPLNIYGGVGGRMKGLAVKDSETVLHLVAKVWKVTIIWDLNIKLSLC